MLDRLKKKSPPPNGPDFSAIDSQAKAEDRFRKGDVEKLFLLPLEFGGQDIPDNYLFVPLGVADVKAGIDNNVIRPLIEEGRITQYRATPEYQGASFIPIAIKIEAFNPGNFTTTINIWERRSREIEFVIRRVRRVFETHRSRQVAGASRRLDAPFPLRVEAWLEWFE